MKSGAALDVRQQRFSENEERSRIPLDCEKDQARGETRGG